MASRIKTALQERSRAKAARTAVEQQLPMAVPPFDAGGSAADYWAARIVQQPREWYAGVQMAKFPEDLRVYEHLLWLTRANVVIEIGVSFGASALWFRDRLRANVHYGRIGAPKVISIDLDVDKPRALLAEADPTYTEDIELMAGDILDPELPDRVAALVPESARCMVIEDSAHVYDTTLAALKGFTRFVPRGGYFVVEDTYIDRPELRLSEDWPSGAGQALEAWLASPDAGDFRQRRDRELYGMTVSPGGFLERVGGDARLGRS